MRHRLVSLFQWLVWLPLLLGAALAQASISVVITPSGTVSNNNITVVIRVTSSNVGSPAITARVNGADVSAALNQGGTFSTTAGVTTITAPYLFGAGTYSLSATATLAGETATGASTFTVTGDPQESYKNTILAKISDYQHQWDGQQFSRWINTGNASAFANRAFQPAFQVYIDPGYLNSTGAVAAYVEKYIIKMVWTYYDQDLLLAADPAVFTNGGTNDEETLWHEMIHAVSHGLQVAGSSPRLTADDHLYIEWAESCVRGFSWLKSFETYAQQNGIASTDPTIAANARQRWKKFVDACNQSTYGSMPTAAQKAEFKSVIGFDVDPNTIKSGYMGLGYAPTYFADVNVTITSPATGTQTSDNQTLVTATVVNNEPTVTLTRAGFAVNGVIQETALSGNGFSTTAVLKTGDNSIVGGVMSTTGEIFQSLPITVKSTAINNTYHARISWDKNDTDVDLHFSWSGGSECYYSNKTPNWGTAATSPRLDVDNTKGFGPENITIGGLPGPGTYRIFVRYYSDHSNGPTTVSAAIYENGVARFSDSRTLSSGENWTLMEFTIQ